MGTFADWVRRRMKIVGMSTLRELSTQVGVTEKTMSEILKHPEKKRDPSLILWLARTLMVNREELEALRAGKQVQVRDDDRAMWVHYENGRPRTLDLPGVPTDTLRRFLEAVKGNEGRELTRAINVYLALREATREDSATPRRRGA